MILHEPPVVLHCWIHPSPASMRVVCRCCTVPRSDLCLSLSHSSIATMGGRHVGVAKSLLGGGADGEVEDREELTAMHWAARMGQDAVLRVLLEHDLDIEVGRQCET